jgi:transaldolase
MDDVGLTLEDQGVAGFHQSFQDVLGELDGKARRLALLGSPTDATAGRRA